MSFLGFELFLKQTVGLDTASISPALVTRAIQARIKACGISDPETYGHLLRTSEVEMQELIEAVIVPETWFFRDREAFMTLARVALDEWPSTRPGDVLRLLSLPCSTGEEPYSMAMALLDAGLPPQRFRIDAIDISRRALEQARGGVYGKNSFRGGDLEFRNRYFELESSGWRLMEKVRRQVHFEPGNLIDGHFLPGLHTYDAIFCRNVLIYFDRKAQEGVIDTLERLLVPNGILFMGPAETSLLLPHRFVPAKLAHVFAFRKANSRAALVKEKAAGEPTTRRRAGTTLPASPASSSIRKTPRTVSFPTVSPSIPMLSPASTNTLDEVMQLADQGRLAEASTQCDAHIREQGPSARAYYLRGLICDAGRQSQEAIEFYRKALYLDPQNEEVLVHLASLLKNQGDVGGAGILLNRARRLTQRQKA